MHAFWNEKEGTPAYLNEMVRQARDPLVFLSRGNIRPTPGSFFPSPQYMFYKNVAIIGGLIVYLGLKADLRALKSKQKLD